MRRRWLGCIFGALLGSSSASAADPVAERVWLVAASQDGTKVNWLSAKQGPYRVPNGSGLRWFVKNAKAGAPTLAEAGKEYAQLGFEAPQPGHFDVALGSVLLRIDAVELRALDFRGARVDTRASHASLSRTLPAELGGLPGIDEDALHFLLIAPAGLEAPGLQVLSLGPSAEPVDALPKLQLQPAACPAGVAPELVCRQTAPLRAVADALDRNQGAVRERSLRAVVGGSLRFALLGRPFAELKVGGPRSSRVGPIERLRAKLRVFLVREQKGGAPPVGSTDAEARDIIARELTSAAGLWGQCGIELGAPGKPTIQLVDPPRAQLLTVGCGVGALASGGELKLRVGERTVTLTTKAGESPTSVALRLLDALPAGEQRAAKVFENQRAAGDAVATADLWVRADAKLQPSAEPLSSDPTLPLCLAGVDLSDGLTHFGDIDAFVGTVEERALLRAFDDGDATTVELIVVPSFAHSERIGESFIQTSGSSLSSAVIIDRQAIVAGARSFALAHELGHVFLAMPGHPDDFGVDQSWSLMDADVADSTIFGPRRLSVAECERAVTQSGPDGVVPLLARVPLR